jgi:ribonucleoside-diphosphate reductase beta chain
VATLEELAQQPDPGAREDGDGGQQLMTPQQLYELWERQHWQSKEIDFSKDKEDWSSLSEDQQNHLVWALASNYIGEERVTSEFAGLLMAYSDLSEESFLATQQVDEARHMQFFDRFYDEVVGFEADDTAGRIERGREEMNESFTKLFDEILVDAKNRLIENPDDVEAKVDFVTVYHLVIEGTLALTAQKFVTDYLEENDLLPGFVEGFDNVARDEHRHVAYGTWFLQQTAGQDEKLAERVQQKLRELLPTAQGVLVPPGQDPEEFELLGYSSQEVNEFAFNTLTRRLSAIGVSLNGGEESDEGSDEEGGDADS